jgi:hypothetical protein
MARYIKNEQKILKRVKAHIRNSKDFEKAILLLLETEEECLLFKNFETKHPEGKISLSEQILNQKHRLSETEQYAAEIISFMLKGLEKDYLEIQFLQDSQRQVRVQEFKKMLFEKLVMTNSVSYIMVDDYSELFKKEMKKYYSLE